MAIAVGYSRVSTAMQVANGDSLAAQRSRIAGWCAYQGLALDGIEEDAGISGAATENRPGFRTAIRRVLEGPGGAVFVVCKLDRLGRNAIDVQETLAVLLDAGVRVVSLGDGIDSASGMGSALLKLLTSILATFAELEKEAIVARLQDGRRHARSNGRVYSREAAYGARNGNDGSLVEDDAELRTVARIRELRAGGLTLRAIGARLLDEGIRPRRAATWTPAVVARIASGVRTPAKPKPSARIAKARAAFLFKEEVG